MIDYQIVVPTNAYSIRAVGRMLRRQLAVIISGKQRTCLSYICFVPSLMYMSAVPNAYLGSFPCHHSCFVSGLSMRCPDWIPQL